MSKRPLTAGERVFLAGYNRAFEMFLGFRQDAIHAEFIRTFGIGGLLKFFKSMGQTLGFLAERYGEATANHLVGFAGMMNGCRYCGVGHNLTANVMIFRDTEELFPIDELDIPRLQLMTDDEIMSEMEQRLDGTKHQEVLRLLRRLDELHKGAPLNESDDDLYLAAALDLWNWNNECTVEIGFDLHPEDIPSFTRINRDRALYERYRAARDAEPS